MNILGKAWLYPWSPLSTQQLWVSPLWPTPPTCRATVFGTAWSQRALHQSSSKRYLDLIHYVRILEVVTKGEDEVVIDIIRQLFQDHHCLRYSIMRCSKDWFAKAVIATNQFMKQAQLNSVSVNVDVWPQYDASRSSWSSVCIYNFMRPPVPLKGTFLQTYDNGLSHQQGRFEDRLNFYVEASWWSIHAKSLPVCCTCLDGWCL